MRTGLGMARTFLGAALVAGVLSGGCEGNVNDEEVSYLTVRAVSLTSAGGFADKTVRDWFGVSSDGRYVVFNTTANMTPLETNNRNNIYVRDVVSGSTSIVSLNYLGAVTTTGHSYNPKISPDGRYISFYSSATDLVSISGFTNPASGAHIYVQDLVTGVRIPVTIQTNGLAPLANGTYSGISDVLADSNPSGYVYVVFDAYSPGVSPELNGGSYIQVYVRQIPKAHFAGTPPLTNADLASEVTVRVSDDAYAADGDVFGNSDSYRGVIGQDGSNIYVAWQSYATDLVGNTLQGTPNYTDIFWRPLSKATPPVPGTTILVSMKNGGLTYEGGDNYSDGVLAISGDGQYVAFRSSARNLCATAETGLTNYPDVFRRGPLITSGVAAPMSRASEGALGEANDSSDWPSISGDGSLVVFHSYATNLVEGDTNSKRDIFVKDYSAAGEVRRVSVTVWGLQADDQSYDPVISGDGTSVAFLSYAKNLLFGSVSSTIPQLYLRRF